MNDAQKLILRTLAGKREGRFFAGELTTVNNERTVYCTGSDIGDLVAQRMLTSSGDQTFKLTNRGERYAKLLGY